MSMANLQPVKVLLITQWVGQAWEELSDKKEMTVRVFRKCGISVAAVGSEDFDIHMEGLDDYEVWMTLMSICKCK